MGAFILSLHQSVVFSSASPTATQIEAALQSIPLVAARASRQAMGLLDDGGFVGSARVTRRTGTFQRITDVSWLYSWTPRATPADEATAARNIADYIRTQADLVIQAQFGLTQVPGAPVDLSPEELRGGWSLAQILPYDPAVNGTVDWWQSGAASRTNTRDAFDLNEQTGSNASVDNPVGPTTNHAPDMNPLGTNDPNSAFNKLFGLATTVAWVAGGIAVMVYVVGPLVGAVLSPKTPRTNPSPYADRLAAANRLTDTANAHRLSGEMKQLAGDANAKLSPTQKSQLREFYARGMDLHMAAYGAQRAAGNTGVEMHHARMIESYRIKKGQLAG